MTYSSLKEMTGGWFVGNFEPTLQPADTVEAAVKYYKAGDHEAAHLHKIAREFTVIVFGEVEMNGHHHGPGSIIVIEPGEATDFRALTDCATAVVKMPCVKGDKYLVETNTH